MISSMKNIRPIPLKYVFPDLSPTTLKQSSGGYMTPIWGNYAIKSHQAEKS